MYRFRNYNLRVKIGKYIYETRIKKGLTQEQLADKAGIARSTVTRTELRDQDISVCHLNQIAKGLGIKLSKLLKDIGC